MEDILKIATGVVLGLVVYAIIDLFAISMLEARFGPAK